MSKCTAEKIARCEKKGKICNPDSGRCVKKDGRIGKELLGKKSKKKKAAKKSAKKKAAKKSAKKTAKKTAKKKKPNENTRQLTEPLPLAARDPQIYSMYPMMECNKFISSLTPSEVKIVPWDWMISHIPGPEYLADLPLYKLSRGKRLAEKEPRALNASTISARLLQEALQKPPYNVWTNLRILECSKLNPTICRKNVGCIKYYTKCWWYHQALKQPWDVVANRDKLNTPGIHLQITSPKNFDLFVLQWRNAYYASMPGAVPNRGIRVIDIDPAKVTTIFIPEGVTNIPNNAFSVWYSVGGNGQRAARLMNLDPHGVSRLMYVALPSSLKTIGRNSFNFCYNLISIDLSNTKVTKIMPHTFANCVSLCSVFLPKILQEIDDFAFQDCISLKEIDLSETVVTKIGILAFNFCISLVSVKFPDTLSQIGGRVFDSCFKLPKIDLSNTKLRFPRDAQELDQDYRAGYPRRGLRSRYASHAFKNCTSLEKVILPEGVDRKLIIGELNMFEGTPAKNYLPWESDSDSEWSPPEDGDLSDMD